MSRGRSVRRVDIGSLVDYLDEVRVQRGWTQAELARQSGVYGSTVNRLLSGLQPDIHAGNLAAIAQSLGLELALVKGNKIVKRAGE